MITTNDFAVTEESTGFAASNLPAGARAFLPEISLAAAIFEDALRCMQRARGSVTHLQSEEAFEWMASERCDWPFAFVNVCDFLGIDAEVVRARLGAVAGRASS